MYIDKLVIRFYMNDEYEVIGPQSDDSLFKGSMADCVAYIEAINNGYYQ